MNQDVVQAYASNPELIREGQKQLQAMLERSATDADFRRRLLTDPRSAVSEFTGHELPESWNVVFVENQASATLVLPDPIDPAAELSEAELTAVAGGVTTSPVCSAIAIVALGLWAWDQYEAD
jgi:hypothetical protein